MQFIFKKPAFFVKVMQLPASGIKQWVFAIWQKKGYGSVLQRLR
jgi:hypothetical protein